MTRAHLLRAATVAVFLAVVVIAVVRFFPQTSRTQRPDDTADALSVERAIHVAGTRPITVRGFVFLGPGGFPLRLCAGVERLALPECLGPYITLRGVNEGSFDLRTAGEGDDARQFQEQPVTLLGVLNGTDMQVQQVLQ